MLQVGDGGEVTHGQTSFVLVDPEIRAVAVNLFECFHELVIVLFEGSVEFWLLLNELDFPPQLLA